LLFASFFCWTRKNPSRVAMSTFQSSLLLNSKGFNSS